MSDADIPTENYELLEVKPKSKKERVNDQEIDYYPESPSLVRRLRFNQTTDKSDTSSQKKFVLQSN